MSRRLATVWGTILLVFMHGGVKAEMLQPCYLVDMHTAGVFPRASFGIETRVYPAIDRRLGTGLSMGLAFGVTDRLSAGLSYGGEGLVGNGSRARFNPFPGAFVKYRVVEESFVAPGVALGYDHLGHGGVADSGTFGYQGYVFKSPGFFVALSKNYLLLRIFQLGFHGGVTFSMEDVERVRWPNGYTGLDLGVNDELGLALEYDFGLNVRDPRASGDPLYARPHDGFLNAGIRWAFAQTFTTEFVARDLLEKRERVDGSRLGWGRELRITYFSQF